MRTLNRIGRTVVAAGLSLLLAGGVGLPLAALAAGSNTAATPSPAPTRRQDLQAMRARMLAQAKAEDATLEKLVAELNKVPEARKVDIMATILNRLVAERHQMVTDMTAMQGRTQQLRNEARPNRSLGMSASSGMKGEPATAQK